MEWYLWVVVVVAFVVVAMGMFLSIYADTQTKTKINYADLDLDDDDDDEAAPSTAQFRLHYTDAKGDSTRRDITIEPFGATARKFEAYCHTRKAHRTFLFDRIVQVVDLDTGEVLTSAAFARRVKGSRLP